MTHVQSSHMKKKFIIFDCDGVLVNTEVISNQVIAEFLHSQGRAITEEECTKLFTGKSEQLINQTITEQVGEELPQALLIFLHQNTLKTITGGSSLKPLMYEVLEYLSKHNIDRCVASNSHHKWITNCLKITDQLKFFDTNKIYDVDRVLTPKPAPDLFFACSK